MNYVPKLNKRDTPYVISDEIITLSNGSGEKFLDHDNVRTKSIEIWSMPKRTGKKFTTFTSENPANNEWKTLVKVFAEGTQVYVTYETTGDQVEADDINELQTAIKLIDKDLHDHKESPHADMQANIYDSDFDGVVNRADFADEVDWSGVNNKPETYLPSSHQHVVDDITGLQAELNSKETPSGAQTKANSAVTTANSYTDSRISNLVGTAPVVLDTLNELAAALGNDPNFATTVASQIAEKETPAGAQDKANNALASANVYTDIHANSKNNPHGVSKDQVGLAYVDNIQQATKTEFNAHANDLVRHVSENDRTFWDSKANGSHTHDESDLTDLDKYTRSEVDTKLASKADSAGIKNTGTSGGTSFVIEESDATKRPAIFLTNDLGRAGFFWYGSNYQTYGGKFRIHLDSKSDVLFTNVSDVLVDGKKVFHEGNTSIPNKTSQLTNDSGYVTSVELGNAGYGDMTKAVYDLDGDGIVDRAKVADSVVWANVTGTPSTFVPSSHTHTIANVTGLQSSLDAKETPAGAQAKVDLHTNLKNNPHAVTKSQVGLGSVSNYGVATQTDAESGTSISKYMTPLRTKQAIEKFAMPKGPLTWNDLSGGGV